MCVEARRTSLKKCFEQMRFKRRRIYYLAIWRNAQFAPRSRLKEGTWQHQFSATVLCMRRREKKEQMIIGFDHFLQDSQQSILNTSNAELVQSTPSCLIKDRCVQIKKHFSFSGRSKVDILHDQMTFYVLTYKRVFP